MKNLFEKIYNDFGELNGIFHLAGIIGEEIIKPLSILDENDIELQLKAKVEGTKIINKLLRRKEVDFVVLNSSISTLLGGIGMSAYSSANHFMNIFARKVAKPTGTKWISINWDGWFINPQERFIKNEIIKNSIINDEGIIALEKILNNYNSPVIYVSTTDLNNRIKSLFEKSAEETEIISEEEKQISETNFSRQNISTPFSAPITELEVKVTKIWRELLGIEQIGINDDFFELGGNSLLGTQLVSRLRTTFNAELPLKILFETPTVNGIVKAIENERGIKKEKTENVEELLEKINNISDEEAKKLLENKNELLKNF